MDVSSGTSEPGSLLTTKHFIPPTRPDLVSRPRLLERLDDSRHRKLTLVSAPAGFGKTTLLSEWINRGKAGSRIAWLALDERDSDPIRFLAYLVTALLNVEPHIAITRLAGLQSPPPLETLLVGVINEIAVLPDHLTLVLDDYHAIEAQPIHDGVTFLLDHMPPQMHVVISTRIDPPLPIARLRARGQLTELRADDLRFTVDEVTDLLNGVMGLNLSAADVNALEARTEGWIVGLQMASLAIQARLSQARFAKPGRDDVSGFIRAFSGSHRFILDYLVEEVLEQQSPEAQQFLLETSILARLTPPLCDFITDRDDSQSILQSLAAANLFLVPLDEERRWYRYHHLFADLLLSRLEQSRPDQVPILHRRATAWYVQRGSIAEAVSHALAAADFDQAADLVEDIAWDVLIRGEMATLLGWLHALPEGLVRSRPRLAILSAWALSFTGQWDDAELHLQRVGGQQLQGEVAAVRAYVAGARGDVPGTISLAEQALEHLPEENLFLRSLVTLSLGIAHFSHGQPTAAIRSLTRAIALSRQVGQPYLTLAATATLGHVHGIRGSLRRALETYQEALPMGRPCQGRPVPFAGISHVGIAEVLYEWNDLDGALRHAQQGVKLTELGGFTVYQLAGYARLVEVSQAQGDLPRASEVIGKAERLVQGRDYPYMRSVIAALRVRLWLARGNLAAASRWAREHSSRPGQELNLAREVEQIAQARVLIATGKPDEAQAVLTRLLQAAETGGRMARAIEVLTLQTLAFQAQGHMDQALSALERALYLAEPEGYVRTFVDQGEPMAGLLRRALSRGIAPDYAARLLAAFDEEAAPISPALESLVEPLTERECEVLRLIVAGFSNAEIAQELVIAVSTVKSHINHIYGKLDIESRTQAVARARELKLL